MFPLRKTTTALRSAVSRSPAAAGATSPPRRHGPCGQGVRPVPGLGEGRRAAVCRVEDVLLPAFDSWWNRRPVRQSARFVRCPGPFHWLVSVFGAIQAWAEIASEDQAPQEQGLTLVNHHVLKDGTRVGSKQISDFTRGFADALYAKILVVQEKKEHAPIVTRERRRFANAAMTACRRAWFIGQRAEENTFLRQSFSKMGIEESGGQARPRARRRPRRGNNWSRSELRRRSLATAPLRRPHSQRGNGCSARSICSARSNFALETERAAERCPVWCIQRMARRLVAAVR